MTNQHQIVQDEMRKLISKSCVFTENLSRDYYGFQKSLLKFYFGAIDVTIDFDQQTILLWNSQPRNTDNYRLYDCGDAVAARVSYSNLEETLKGCLEEGETQARFYKTMLFHYNNHTDDSNVMSVSA
ncbi:hypothetical protein G5B37_05980 [Rasiella rasia]|uniref:Uncharacterized protein n=1 Tax=Rasiella rasia TaxID=2744027 RepID=A0A6G6GN46_9FLAO|nr:hypothetical protein [Rasiella rasia]QIE59121.1 hypothetical protein G5B37_05980 [Rasiella rasia]